jgi:uncharacterized protein
MYERSQCAVLAKRLQETRKFIQVLAGPRQVGKTTLVRQVLEKNAQPWHYANADEAGTSNADWISLQWEVARLKLKQSGAKFAILAIDEIQKISDWSSSVKAQWDNDTLQGVQLHVVLLGSSKLLLQRGLTESLLGRFELTYVPHWSLNEMESAFGVQQDAYIWFGGYPGSVELYPDEQRWRAYIRDAFVEPSISKDILALSRIDKPALLRALFEFGCTFSGQILSYNKMLGQLDGAGNTTTLVHYLQLTDSAGLLSGLEKYSGSIIKSKQSSPKFQVQNNALMAIRVFDDFRTTRAKPENWGRLVESAVGAHLVNATKVTPDLGLTYWRDGNDEVDFVLKYQDKILGLEVKSAGAGNQMGMSVFQKKYPEARVLLVGATGLPIDVFLRMNPIALFE